MSAKSKAELRFLFAKDKKLGLEFARATPNIAALPDHVAKRAKAVAKGLGRK
jgi:hypothetical protein